MAADLLLGNVSWHRLPAGEAVRSVAEVVYIPIYVTSSPEVGVQAVMEIMVSSTAWEAMVVANLISFVSSMLTDLKVGAATGVRSFILRPPVQVD